MTDYNTSDLDVFLSDFATTVTCSTWNKTIDAIFDEDFVEFEDLSGNAPSLLARASDIPDTRLAGDLFSFVHPTTGVETEYKLVDVVTSELGTLRLVLALAA